MTTHQRDLCRAINRHGQILSQFQDAKRMGRFTAPTWHAALVVAAQQARRWLWLAQAGEERERTVYGVCAPTADMTKHIEKPIISPCLDR